MPSGRRVCRSLATTPTPSPPDVYVRCAHRWRPNQVYRTGHVAGRGGATFTAFDVADSTRPPGHEREYPADELWATFDRFAREILPVASDAGMRLAFPNPIAP